MKIYKKPEIWKLINQRKQIFISQKSGQFHFRVVLHWSGDVSQDSFFLPNWQRLILLSHHDSDEFLLGSGGEFWKDFLEILKRYMGGSNALYCQLECGQ